MALESNSPQFTVRLSRIFPPKQGWVWLAIMLFLLSACQSQISAADDSAAATPTAVSLPPTATNTAVLPPPPTMISAAAEPTAEQPTPTLETAPTDGPQEVAPDTPTPEPTIVPTATNSLAIPGLPEPLPTPHGVYSWTLQVPVLMYHYVSTPPADADIYRTDLSTEPEMFRQQMAFLAENGYTTIDLYDLSLAIVNKLTLPDKPIILTFDDGYLDNYENAFPILQEFGFTGTFFIITDFVDQQLPGYVTWEMLQEMAAAGMRIESHSKNHPDLTGKDRDFLIWQMLGSQETLAAHLGYTPRYFCYPSGRY
ncbi:MAG: polysaccharide deacetylase family protein, partial [Anaerolineales bacterium]|nr:polysaccharide deacetylase family protein [Anaerolineales bacterium]